MSKARKAGIVLIAALVGVGGVFVHFGWPGQLYAHWHNSWYGNQAPDKNIWLPDYKVAVEGKPIPGITDMSGLAYDPDHDRILGITNGVPMEILALTRDGDLLERYPLIGFEDTEGIAYMGKGRVVIVDERQQRLHIFTLPETAGPIRADQTESLAIEINLSAHNKGFEGVTYDPANDRIFAIKERDPRQLYSITGMLGSIGNRMQIRIKDLTSWVDRGVFSKDLSEGYYDPRTGHLLLLSEESSNLTELDQQGNFVSILSLRALAGDLKRTLPQAEGMTMDNKGELYIVSEPNLFYRFTQTKAGLSASAEKH
ncbi:SdiA-regulated domain-containing protein [Pseudomonas sp. PDM10]|uniref:SdiA-regulated domain-containing protein n=1 Tax=Pseudomonas sp. PDM10 TaxID=2769269 RepID=UPI00178389B6|nr:SdiA-regulated domain-containing protein [Pseudomonas sp. PDM10]MBD9602831.1 SdiA-regulated domain-containing protein [Pseudomonas sp. PDM10]